jgi:hypothetical protein
VSRNPVSWTLRIVGNSVAQNCVSFVSKRNVSGQPHERDQLRATLNQAAVGLLAQDGVTPALAEKSVTACTLEAKSDTNPV